MTVPRTVFAREKLTDNGFRGQGRERYRRDKFLSGRRDNHLNLCARLHEEADKRAGLIGGDAARDAEDDMFAFEMLHFMGKSVLGALV